MIFDFFTLVFVHLSTGAPLWDLMGLYWQKEFFTSQLSLSFWVCLLVMLWWGLLLWSVLGWGNCLILRTGVGASIPLAENSWIEVWAWFLTQVRLLDSLVSLTRWLGLSTIISTIISIRRGYKLASLPWQGSRPGHRASITHCLGVRIRPEWALSSLVGWSYWFCSGDGGDLGCGLCSGATIYVGALNGLQQLPIFSGQVRAVFSDGRGYRLNSLPGYNRTNL